MLTVKNGPLLSWWTSASPAANPVFILKLFNCRQGQRVPGGEATAAQEALTAVFSVEKSLNKKINLATRSWAFIIV